MSSNAEAGVAGTATERWILTFTSREKPGLLHAVTGVLLEREGDIVELKQFDDARSDRYFLRVEFALPAGGPEALGALRDALAAVAADAGGDAQWSLRRGGAHQRVLLMVSKFEHCLNDLLFRSRVGEIPADIALVVSNHPDHRELVEWHGIPFFHVPVTKDTKPEAEAKLLELMERFEVDLVVLARYMQILSDELTLKLEGRAINIHHSFLPSFKGAKPYHQAYARGVKTVGATAHYVSGDLDEGPIIAQQVQPVDHSFGPEDLVAAGRDTECKALADAVKWHCEGRVFLDGNRTVVLR